MGNVQGKKSGRSKQRKQGKKRNNKSNSRANNNRNRRNNNHVESLVRVGSKVLKESDLPNNDTGSRMKVGRASTYDHVHNVVLTNFDTSSNHHKNNNNGRCGILNLGNTCFLNSSLQCLSNTIPLTDYFLGYDYRKEINYNNVLGTRGALVNSYCTLMKQMWLSSSKSLDPSEFFAPLVKFAPDFCDGQQHDSQELLAFLLDGIHEDLNRVYNKPYIEDEDGNGTNDEGDAVVAWQNYLLRNRSIIVDLFQGQLRNTILCSVCGFTKVKFEPFMYLSLPLSKHTNTLDDCLDLYCETECLSGDNQWYCSSCQFHVNATKKLDLWMLPPILIVHLKRFDYRGRKIESSIDYPLENWNLTKAVKSKNGLYPLFDLYAVSNHAGNLNGGHYTAMVKNRFDDAWYEMNDSTTRRISPSSVKGNRKAYLLFYNRVEKTGERKRSDPKVMRQSIDRPELWPHMQLNTTARNDFKSFRRSTVVTKLPTVGGGEGSAEMDTIAESFEA